MSSSRTIEKVVPATNGHITRLIGTVDVDGKGTNHPLPEVDPFILLDTGIISKNHMPPFGPHPHRGHSVVTILMRGKVKSWDSFRSREESETISAPSSYWVDAGSGVFHDECSVIEDESDESQHMHLFQLWVGVKEKDRKKPPRVQYDCDLQKVELKDADGQVVGSGIHFVGGETSKIETPHPISVVHVQQDKGTTYRHAIDPTQSGFVVHMKGKPSMGGTAPDKENDVLVLQNDDSGSGPAYLEIKTTSEEGAEYLVCTGEKHHEKWCKKLVANGAVIAATEDEARGFVKEVEAMSVAGKAEGGSFAPFGM